MLGNIPAFLIFASVMRSSAGFVKFFHIGLDMAGQVGRFARLIY